jgi:hypothetical protein
MMPWLTAIPGALKLVPKWVWYALALALAWHFALSWHRGQVKAHDADIVAARDAQWQARFDAMRAKADDVRRKAEALSAQISTTLKDQNDATNRHIAVDAGDLRLRGPGAAAAIGCRPGDHPGLSAAAGQPGAAGDQRPHAAASALPGGNRRTDVTPVPGAGISDDAQAAVPWRWLVGRAEQADLDRAEVLTWRDWYARQTEAWQRLRSPPANPTPSTEGKTTNGR